ncbi:MAG: type II 3-dehydroquinate dehydratase [Deltaproteobacteria bacterium GWA2_38_16]|nr:MAG: type II 3-dehydroquinate dehydratase [Deltaproteobacteria bacterium GWA2_38_16]OGQ01789.1 MAG: type II 3-dehydroquinate dehydratase [Deltaproteobacteria bacterium RIFCSPHIGHO2_02_FULL_38_15]OGQ30244.1 MAG: type II 3-dehydroquinate dehydratase [Deltaproteobacteria bacterium RIFCSPLOWO2_01_FULL_38_9]OGQ58889.1 MAG: type II 3-dehydroquinate dehydratase [Deltaproteobacteria bacterium RIFCSPLOWO2_12_FULL_38_8]HBQ21403.1 type II 3-dehydroquinate dehydratase [Deltaproteobacteria bacterium]
MKKILVIHGPNLNLLGKREPNLYGTTTLKSINDRIQKAAKQKCYKTLFYQSNIEGRIVSKIQQSFKKVSGILINPAAYTHTSVAIRDALLTAHLPTVEVHLTNIHQREPFRKHSLISDIVNGQVIGFGVKSYELGLSALIQTIERSLE